MLFRRLSREPADQRCAQRDIRYLGAQFFYDALKIRTIRSSSHTF